MSQPAREACFTAEQVQYLITIPGIPEDLVRRLREAPGGRVRLTLHERDEVMARVGDYLQRVGFDRDFETTRDGQISEEIIDALSSATSE